MVGTNEDFAMRKKFEMQQITEHDQRLVGTAAKHLIIPICDPIALRRVCGIMHQAASEIEAFTQRRDLSMRSIILHVQDTINVANREIKEITGKGLDPKRRYFDSNKIR